MNIDHVLFPTPQTRLGSTQVPWDNAEVSIPRYGFGLNIDAEAEVSIAVGANADAEVNISAPTVAAPTDAYGVHLGQGTVLMQWKHAAPTHVDYYELLASDSPSGPFGKYQQGEFRNLRGVVNNVPLGIQAYFRLRAVGKNQTVSSDVPVRQGKLDKPIFAFEVRGIAGSIIPKDSIFTVHDKSTGLLMAIAAVSDIVI